MKDPIKIIHKFKNNNKRIQYKIFIFIGSFIPSNIKKILNDIKDKDFTTMLTTILIGDYSHMEKYYGKQWYEFFFISYHINASRKMINNNSTKKKQLETKFGKEWFNEHIHAPPQKKNITFICSFLL